MLKALLITLLIAGALATESNETSSAGGPKEGTAGGHYYPNYGYPPPPPPPAYSYPWAPPAYTPPLVDDYVCDIDASILVVTNAGRDSGYGNDNGYGNNNGYGSSQNTNPYGGHHHHYPQQQKPNADRLKCAVIANYDEATCTSCCRIAARRDRSIASASVIGFIVDETQLDYDQNDNNGPYRAKRGAPPQETYGVPPRGASPPASQRPSPYYPPVTPVIVSQANPLGPKGRCVCCAPRKFGVPHYAHHHPGGY